MHHTHKNIVFGIFLVIIVIVASFAGIFLTSYSSTSGLSRPHRSTSIVASSSASSSSTKGDGNGIGNGIEGFANKVFTMKNEVYLPYFTLFFSVGETDHKISFIPSVMDVSCVMLTD